MLRHPSASGPTLTPSTRRAAPGQRVTLKMSGFRAGEKIRLFWDGKQLSGTDTANGSGGLNKAFLVVPITARAGTHSVKAMGMLSGNTASSTITVPAAALRVPRHIIAGQLVNIRGDDFGASETVYLYWDKEHLQFKAVRTNAQGSFQGRFGPVSVHMAAGRHTLIARGRQTRRLVRLSVTILPAPAPTVAATPMPAPATPTAVPSPTPAATTTPAGTNGIVAENALPGSSDWAITKPSVAGHLVEGYASATSVNIGGQINLFVNTAPASAYTLDLYRMGWYGGAGARLVLHVAGLAGISQPACPQDPIRRTVSCAWTNPYALSVPTAWRSGVYLAKLTRADGYQSYIIFVVRDDSSHSPLLFQTSVNTYQAYNAWGGPSLYGGSDESSSNFAQRAYAVSFDRPYQRGYGAGDFLYWEYPMVQWLERGGYDVSYQTDLDTDASAAILEQHKVLLVVGHDEYWSKGMRDNVEAAVAAGVSVAFLGANIGYWQVRLEGSSLGAKRVMVCYKDKTLDPLASTQPALATVKWRDPLVNRPEDALIGQEFEGWFYPPYPGLVVQNTGAWPYYQTGLHDGDVIPGVVGYEYDGVQHDATTPQDLQILATTPVTNYNGTKGTANVTLYKAASGAQVFSAGSIVWSWGLMDDDISAGDNNWSKHHVANAALQRMTANILYTFTHS